MNLEPNAGPLPRRTILRGLGTIVALPFLEAMFPSTLVAATPKTPKSPKGPPRRLAFIYVPNGAHMPSWTPQAVGGNFTVPSILKPLAPFKDDMLVLSGLTQDKARANGDGAGDHARAAAAFLTGRQPLKTRGANIRAGVSADQVVAQELGHLTTFPSLELGCERGGQTGDCDSGYSCAYSNNIAWRNESMPLAKEVDPRLLFERLFPNITTREGQKRSKYRKSVLDYVLEDASRLGAKLGASDKRKLDEYMVSIREIEGRIQKAEADAKKRSPSSAQSKDAAKLGSSLPGGVPQDYGEHIRLMGDLLVLALQADLTRVATFMLANEGSNRSYRDIGVPEGHHDLSHHGNEKAKQEKVERINTFHAEQLAYILKKLRAAREGGASLLDRSIIVYGSGIGDGNRHNHDELPILVAGKGGGTLRPGRHIRYPKNTPLNNLFLALLARMEVSREALGDSTGMLADLS